MAALRALNRACQNLLLIGKKKLVEGIQGALTNASDIITLITFPGPSYSSILALALIVGFFLCSINKLLKQTIKAYVEA